MSFFYNESRESSKPKAPKKVARKDIPIHSLQAMGCSVCPRDKDDSLRSPKMAPSGARRPLIYLLGTTPSSEDDQEGVHWTDKAGAVLYAKFGRDWMERDVRSNYIMQCKPNAERGLDDTTQATECCRRRIEADIEESEPLVIVGVGDPPLRWALPSLPSGSATTMNHRGQLFPVKIGRHTCWYYSVMFPNFAYKKGGRKSEYEVALEHDLRWVKDFAADCAVPEGPRPKVWSKPYDEGIEIITGNEPGDMQRLERALQRIAGYPKPALDIETSGLRVYMQRDPLLLTAAVGIFDDVVAFALDHPEGWGTDAQRSRAHRLFADFLLASGTKYAHNLAMELEWLPYFYGREILRLTQWGDTMAMAHTLDERKGTKALEIQSLRAFGFNLKDQSNIDVRRPKWWLQYSLRDILRYNGMDTKWTDPLRAHYEPLLAANPAYQSEYERKVRTATTLVLIESLGLPADLEFAERMEDELAQTMRELEAKIKRTPEVRQYEGRYGTFHPTAPEDVLKLLKEICKRDEVSRKDRDGNHEKWTTDEEALALIPAKEVPSAALVLEHRGVAKMLGTYLQPVTRKEILCVDGLIRSKYSQLVAETGRLASEDPNIQNWPKRKAYQRKARGIIAAREKEWMVACDYGQIEFRVVGMASEDRNLVKYCWTGYDVHKYWAERMVKEYPAIKDSIVERFEVDWDEKGLKTLRQEAKNGWVFPQLFGSSVRSCAEQLLIPMNIMEDLAAEFWDEFREVKAWQQGLLEFYERKGYVETLDGRRRRGPMTLNQIINHPIQGTAFSIVCAGMNALSERAQAEEAWDRHPRFNGHDDLSFFMADGNLETNIEIIAREMCRPRYDWINVPLIVEVSVGTRWNELEEIRKYSSEQLFNLRNPYKAAV